MSVPRAAHLSKAVRHLLFLLIAASMCGCPTPGGGQTTRHGPDADGDGIQDSSDNCPTIHNPDQEDCANDGAGDACSFRPDCNGNGVPDECDIAGGASQDCQPDGIPDECQLGGDDCNDNSAPDECDMADGSSEDCDGNGVPDECQVDSDGDGLIDPCDECPEDSSKIEPGLCGCGTADTDLDGDGVPDCIDQCAGGDDTADGDADGTPDDCDQCPNDNPDDANGNGVCDSLDAALDALTGHTCWHLYSPYRETPGQNVSEAQVRRELQMLHDSGARGLVTYEMMNGVEVAPRVAKAIGYEWVFAGVFWWTNGVANGQTESTLENEKAAIESNIEWIDGIVIGNEGLVESPEWNQPRYALEDLRRELQAMKSKYPDRPVTTAEGTVSYEAHPDLVWDASMTDFVFPNVHPWWGGFRDPVEGVNDLLNTIGSDPFSERGDRLLTTPTQNI